MKEFTGEFPQWEEVIVGCGEPGERKYRYAVRIASDFYAVVGVVSDRYMLRDGRDILYFAFENDGGIIRCVYDCNFDEAMEEDYYRGIKELTEKAALLGRCLESFAVKSSFSGAAGQSGSIGKKRRA